VNVAARGGEGPASGSGIEEEVDNVVLLPICRRRRCSPGPLLMLMLVGLRLVSRMVVIMRAVLTGMGVRMDLFPALVLMRMLMFVNVLVLVNMFVIVRVCHLPVLMRM